MVLKLPVLGGLLTKGHPSILRTTARNRNLKKTPTVQYFAAEAEIINRDREIIFKNYASTVSAWIETKAEPSRYFTARLKSSPSSSSFAKQVFNHEWHPSNERYRCAMGDNYTVLIGWITVGTNIFLKIRNTIPREWEIRSHSYEAVYYRKRI